eukprot:TRINITY_DN64_c1_g1_i2.p1 TRINITY_DN64_c1_g1~~TRINITY_DN64_c1_g1_i2.p1  ORF type:complete len:598 (-),score=213.06 TRINITY_DN64_c1_g1_i2:151-1944(-)
MFGSMMGMVSNWLKGEKKSIQVKGVLYLLDEDERWRAIDTQAEATIVQTTKQYASQLVITKGEQEDEEEEEFVYLISPDLQLRKHTGLRGNDGFAWVTPEGNEYSFEFEGAVVPGATSIENLFVLSLCGAIYEITHQTSRDEASERELLDLLQRRRVTATSPVKPTTVTPSKLHATPSTPATFSTPSTSTPSSSTPSKKQSPPTSPFKPSSKAIKSSPKNSPVKTAFTRGRDSPKASPSAPVESYKLPPPSGPHVQVSGTEIVRVPASLFLFDEETKTFNPHTPAVEAAINMTGDGKKTFTYVLFVYDAKDHSLVASQPINNDMHMHFNTEYLSSIWVYTLGSNVWTWSLNFPDSDVDKKFKDQFSICLFETNSERPWSKVADGDKEWILGGFIEEEGENKKDDIDDLMVELEQLQVESEDEDEEVEEEEEEEEEEEDEVDDDDEEEEGEDGQENTGLAVGLANDRSYVVRGSKIGVFKATPRNRLKYCTSINSVKSLKGDIFSPRKIMLHNRDSDMLLLHPDDDKKIFKMDLERGQVVEEWKADGHQSVNEIFNQTKYDEMDDGKSVLGLNRLGFMYLDSRLPGNKMVGGKRYFSS